MAGRPFHVIFFIYFDLSSPCIEGKEEKKSLHALTKNRQCHIEHITNSVEVSMTTKNLANIYRR